MDAKYICGKCLANQCHRCRDKDCTCCAGEGEG